MSRLLHLHLERRIRRTAEAATLEFRPLQGPLNYRPGQFLTLLFHGSDGREIRRSYSLSSTPGLDLLPAITVKRVENGQVSRYLVEQAEIGALFESLPPAGNFTLPSEPSRFPAYVFIGGGSGISPLYGMIRHLLHFEAGLRVFLLYSNRDEESIIFRKELNELAERFPQRFRVIHLLSRPQRVATPAPLPNVQTLPVRLGNELLETLLRQIIGEDIPRAQYYLCGPRGILIKARMTLGYLKVPAEQVHRELFTVKKPRRPRRRYPDARVVLHLPWGVQALRVPSGKSILEAALDAGIPLPYSCRSGICTTCTATCTHGRVDMYTQEGFLDSDTGKGLALTCVGYPATPEVELRFPNLQP